MEYFTDIIYQLVGREDKVAVLTLNSDSDTAKTYSDSITVVFTYTPKIHEKLESNFKQEINEKIHDFVKIRYLNGGDLTKEQIIDLEKNGILSSEIIDIFSGYFPSKNPYYSKETRHIEKLEITFEKQSNGQDYNWIYGFHKKKIKEGIGLSPDGMNFYYAMKLYFEPQNISTEENLIIFPNGVLNTEIELKFIELKIERDNDNEDDWKRLEYLYSNKGKDAFQLISEQLISAGSSMKILYKKNSTLACLIYKRIVQFKDIQLNVMGKKAIYLNAEGFLHIYFRHVSEFKVSDHYNGKDKFQWEEKEIIRLISAVINGLDEEIQAFWVNEPNKRFQLYGEKGYYYQGDYYSFYIESDGRLSTFFKNKKNI